MLSTKIWLEANTERSESNPGRSLGITNNSWRAVWKTVPHDMLTRLCLARHVQNLSRITPMRRICSFTDFYCVFLDLSAPAGRWDFHGLSLAGGNPAPYRRKCNPCSFRH